MSFTTLEFSCLRSWEVPSKSWTEQTWKNLNLSRIDVERWASGFNAQCCAKFLQALSSSSISLCMPCHPPLCIVQITMPEFLYSRFKLKISWAPKLLQIYVLKSADIMVLIWWTHLVFFHVETEDHVWLRLCIVIKCEILDVEWDLNIYVVFHAWHWPGKCKDTLQSGCESPW